MKERLKLTPEQEAKIRPILEEEAAKLKAVRDEHQEDGRPRDRRDALKELRAIQRDTQERVDPLLTPEQRAEWEKMREERREQLRERYRERS